MSDFAILERCLGAIGTTFRLVRYYPPTHPAVQEGLRTVAAQLPAMAAMGTVEWKVGASGMHWRGAQVLPRNAQLSELASLLFARGVRGIQVSPGVTPEHVIALYNVATGTATLDDSSLGRITLQQTRRTTAAPRLSVAQLNPPMAERIVPPVEGPKWPRGGGGELRRATAAFRPDVLPPDVESRRLIGSLLTADSPESLLAAAERLRELVPAVLELRDIALVAELIAGLDRALPRVQDEQTVEQLGLAGEALAEKSLVDRMVYRLGEARIAPVERGFLVGAVGALAAMSVRPTLRAYLAAPAELREPYRAAIRAAADRAMEPLEEALEDGDGTIVAAAAHFMGLTGSPEAVPLLSGLMKHQTDAVREAALYALAEIGGREIARPAVAALRDLSAPVRAAAARVIGVCGDPTASDALARRLEHEEDEGVLAGMLIAIGRLAAPGALGVLAKYAEPGSFLKRRTAHLRAAAIEGIGHIHSTEARALLELYSHDKEPTVRRAAEAALQ
ncbi:MAG TPA: HEAT repeat domain-containing protein [Gemmatimonadales bacterium]|nr:HEAT repeat domain-containing protein [Gemmatimonadales bacterium]